MASAEFIERLKRDAYENSVYYDNLVAQQRKAPGSLKEWEIVDINALKAQIDYLGEVSYGWNYHLRPALADVVPGPLREDRILAEKLNDPKRAATAPRQRRLLLRMAHGYCTGVPRMTMAQLAEWRGFVDADGNPDAARATRAYKVALLDFDLDFARQSQYSMDMDGAGAMAPTEGYAHAL